MSDNESENTCSLTKHARNSSYRRVLVCSPTFSGARLLPWFAEEIFVVKRSAFSDLKVHGIPEHPQQEMFTVAK